MRHYEIMLLVHPDQSERVRVMMDRYVGIIESGEGRVHRNEDLGRRMLAYPIARVHKAHYLLMNVECGSETLNELTGALSFSDAVLRHLVIRRDKAITEQSALAKAAEREAAREGKEYPYDRELAHGRKSSPDGRDKSGVARASGDPAGADAEQASEAPAQGSAETSAGESAAEGEQAGAASTEESPPALAEEGAAPRDPPDSPETDEQEAQDEAGEEGDPEAGADDAPEAAAAGSSEDSPANDRASDADDADDDNAPPDAGEQDTGEKKE